MNVLIVEDNLRLSNLLRDELEKRGHAPRQASSLRTAEDVLRDFSPDAVLLDAMFPTDSDSADFNAPGVLSLLETRPKESRPFTILMSGDDRAAGHFETIRDWWYTGRIVDMVSKNQEGGWNFLKEILLHRVDLHRLGYTQDMENQTGEERKWLEENDIVSRDPAMYRIARSIQRIVRATDNRHAVLVVGANGTGKSLIANAIRKEMQRKQGGRELPFYDFHCGRIQVSTFHDEIFGHVRGSFTDATSDKEGALRAAGEGVLFLDDIQLLAPEARAALLGPIQERTFRQMGSNVNSPFRARLVSATNIDLEKLYEEGKMPDEFYNRIAGSTLFVPPLSQRPGDVEAIASRLALQGPRPLILRPDVIRVMQVYVWPGNVRQLIRVIDRIKIEHAADVVTLESLRALQLDYLGRPIEWLPSRAVPVSSVPPLQGFGWEGTWADLGAEHEELVLEWLRKVVPDQARLPALVKSLENRSAPRPIHYYKALLFAYVRAEKLTHKAFEEALGLGWDFTNRITCYLANIKNGTTPGFDPPFLIRGDAGGKYVYSLA
jgi:DNA-binding NtrC family response regulator